MKIVTYMCENCYEPYDFDSDKNGGFLCPKCGQKMMYWETSEIDPDTNKVVNSYQESLRKQSNPGKPVATAPVVECPYCHSTYTKKITTTGRMMSIGIFGFASKKMGKQWHCNQCGSDF